MDRDVSGVPTRLPDARVIEYAGCKTLDAHVRALAQEVMAARGLCADLYPIDTIRVGDTVRHWSGDWQAVVEHLEQGHSSLTGTELLAFFVGGGFWRVSQLRRVRG